MKVNWLQERTPEPEINSNFGKGRHRNDFLAVFLHQERETIEIINLIHENILTCDKASKDFSQDVLDSYKNTTFARSMYITAACAKALKSHPTTKTWSTIAKLSYHSVEIEHWLTNAMWAYTQSNSEAREAYILLAKSVYQELENGKLNAPSDRINTARKNQLEFWQNTQHPLDELWRGLRHSDFTMYDFECRLFGLINEMAPEVFNKIIGSSKNPYFVNSALLRVGIGPFSPRFSQWEASITAAPAAFDPNGKWNGSVLLPLLLVHARNTLLEPGKQIPRFEADEESVASLTNQTSQLVPFVIKTLTTRADVIATLTRWSSWLMRQLLVVKEDVPNDIRSSNFVDDTLLDAIGNATKDNHLLSSLPIDAAPWEGWCHYCTRAAFSNSGFSEPPPHEEFTRQWKLSPEQWHAAQGRDLLERAQQHTLRDDPPGLLANLLAIPLIKSLDFLSIWKQLWVDTYYLREVLEYGSIDAEERNYSDRTDASELLLIIAYLGLACFDQAASGHSTVQSTEQTSEMYTALTLAAREILHIDDTLKRDKWIDLLQHLAIRRAFWDSDYKKNTGNLIFKPDHQPSVIDHLNFFKNEPSDLISFLHICIRNDIDAIKLKSNLESINIDLRHAIDTVKRLNGLRSQKYPLNGRAMETIKPLLR